ncbi:MAG: ADP-ribosylglycohydrolase family protein [Bacteroidales bacterium]|nr:ADP-ribosylglycohydrolase family protein [Bacteroidales bacterium]
MASRCITFGICRFTYLDWLHTQEWTSRHKDARVDSWLMDVPGLYARRAPGNTCLSALHSNEEGREARNNSCGCGGVMRTAPLALLNQLHGYADGDKLYCDMCAAEAARITHKHPLGFIPSAILNDMLMQILEGIEGKEQRPEYFVERALQRLPEIVSEADEGKKYGELWPEEIRKQKRLISKALDLAFTDIEDHYAIENPSEVAGLAMRRWLSPSTALPSTGIPSRMPL